MKAKVKLGLRASNEIPAIDSLAQFLGRMSFAERIEPVVAHLSKILCPHDVKLEARQPLPGYCHKILEIFRRTYFKNFPALADIVRGGEKGQPIAVDWRLMGRMIGIGLRCLHFSQYELDQSLGLTSEPEQEFLRAFLGSEPLEQTEQAQTINTALTTWNRTAFERGPGAMAELNAGVAEGVKGFINDSGQFAGESNRAGVYWFLLLAWPEIERMQSARPPRTRKDFSAWLAPFAQAGVVSIGDLDQLCHLCGDIGLKFKQPGAPSKK